MFVKNGQTSAFYLVLISIVDCIVVLVALFSDKKSYRKYPVSRLARTQAKFLTDY
jgi:RsiW-degrading membrane proteinase PrsW (M82 family)